MKIKCTTDRAFDNTIAVLKFAGSGEYAVNDDKKTILLYVSSWDWCRLIDIIHFQFKEELGERAWRREIDFYIPRENQEDEKFNKDPKEEKPQKRVMHLVFGEYASKRIPECTFPDDDEDGDDGLDDTLEQVLDSMRNFDATYVVREYDTEGIESKIKTEEKDGTLVFPIDAAEQVITGYLEREKELTFHNDKPTDSAYYSPSLDMVSVPMLSQYQIPEEYYSTTFHELVHSTKLKSRCDRDSEQSGIAAFGNEDYSREELVAEIGSAMLCNRVEIESEKAFKNSVAYIQGWLKALKNDNHAIVWASSRAEKAAKYIIFGKQAIVQA